MNKILVVRFSSIGDIVLTEPVIRALKSTFPDAAISYLAKSAFLPLLEMFAGLDHRYGWTDDRDSGGLLNELKNQQFELLVDLHANIRSARVRAALGVKSVKAKKEWFKRIASVKLNAVAGRPSHAIGRYFAALNSLGIEQDPLPPMLQIPEESQKWWSDQRSLTNYYVIAAGATHATKRAPETLWISLNQALRSRYGMSCLLVGAPSERELLEHLASRFDDSKTVVITEPDLRRAAAVASAARFVISNDSGLAHLAAAVGTPILALFGPTHPVLGFAPLGERAGYYTVNEHCSPCSLHGDRRCFREDRFCFTRMRVDDIVAKLESLIDSRPGASA